MRVDIVAESYVPPDELRKDRAPARGRKKFEKRTDCKKEVHAILDQNEITHEGSLWTRKGREFCGEFTPDELAQLLLDQWLELLDDYTEKTQPLMSFFRLSLLELMIHTKIGEVGRFDQADQ